MAKGIRGSRPQRRGLIAAVCFAAIVVAAAVWLLQHNQKLRAVLGGVSGGPVASQRGNESSSTWFAAILASNSLGAVGNANGRSTAPPPEAVAPSLSAADRRTRGLAQRGATVGYPRLLTSNALQIESQVFVLWGIAVPQTNYRCTSGQATWFCGSEGTRMLREYIGNQLVGCFPKGTDLDGRIVAICYVGTMDLGVWMVQHGWAVADKQVTRNYNVVQAIAKRSGLGIWGSSFDPATFVGAR